MTTLMNARGCLTEDGWKKMQKEIREQVKRGMAFAENGTTPDPATELETDVYANPQPNLSPSANYTHGVKNPLL
ncbi:MAG: hypothetical protein R3B49_09400 [Phycisphaerales bacterium]